MRDAMRDTRYGIWDMGYAIRDTGLRIRDQGLAIPEFALQDFAGSADRQRIAKLHEPRVFVRGELLPAPREQLVLCRGSSGFLHDERLHLFAEPIVRYADDGDE